MSGSALIIDDHPLYRDALMQLLSTIGETVVRVANSAEEALRMSFSLVEARLILLDFNLRFRVSGNGLVDRVAPLMGVEWSF